MENWQKLALAALVVGTLVYIRLAFFTAPQPPAPSEQTTTEETSQKSEEDANLPKSYVSVYFIGQNNNKEEVYKIVKREYDPRTDGTKIKASIAALLKGPSAEEKAHKIYSEIPSGTKLISIQEKPDKIIVNLSSEFENDGGTDGLYKRLYQLIKTANKNTSQNVYLYINGKQADVVGGEGIMINQPLNEKSLDE